MANCAVLSVGGRVSPPHLTRGKEVPMPYTSLIVDRACPYHIQPASISSTSSSAPGNITQPALHHQPRWCKPKTTMHHVIKHSPPIHLNTGTNESAEDSYVDPAK